MSRENTLSPLPLRSPDASGSGKEQLVSVKSTASVVSNLASAPDGRFRATNGAQDLQRDGWAQDPINPRNWSLRRKWCSVAMVSFYTFVTPLGSSMMAPALPNIAKFYNITSPAITAMTLCIFLLSFAIGPLVLAPLSEIYGRTWVLHIGNIFFLVFNLGCAFSHSISTLIAFRFLCGFAGSAPIACGGGSVSDLFSKRTRGSAMALYTLGPLIGPVVGPIAGGFITEKIGFKYIFITISGLCGLASLIAIPFLKETYAPVIRARRASQNSDPEKSLPPDSQAEPPQDTKLRILWLNLSRPVIMLTRSFICFMLSLYMAFIYGCYYMMFATFPGLYKDVYGFSPAAGGLAYIGLGVGFLTATLFSAKFTDNVYNYFTQHHGGKGQPEFRIPALIFGSFFVPIGLLWYGWSAAARNHWIMPMIGTGIFGFGLMASFLPIQLYLVDAFEFAASAVAAASVLRSFLGFVFPLFGQYMFDAMGIGGGNSLLAGLAIVLGIPFPLWIYHNGARLRARNALTATS